MYDPVVHRIDILHGRVGPSPASKHEEPVQRADANDSEP